MFSHSKPPSCSGIRTSYIHFVLELRVQGQCKHSFVLRLFPFWISCPYIIFVDSPSVLLVLYLLTPSPRRHQGLSIAMSNRAPLSLCVPTLSPVLDLLQLTIHFSNDSPPPLHPPNLALSNLYVGLRTFPGRFHLPYMWVIRSFLEICRDSFILYQACPSAIIIDLSSKPSSPSTPSSDELDVELFGDMPVSLFFALAVSTLYRPLHVPFCDTDFLSGK